MSKLVSVAACMVVSNVREDWRITKELIHSIVDGWRPDLSPVILAAHKPGDKPMDLATVAKTWPTIDIELGGKMYTVTPDMAVAALAANTSPNAEYRIIEANRRRVCLAYIQSAYAQAGLKALEYTWTAEVRTYATEADIKREQVRCADKETGVAGLSLREKILAIREDIMSGCYSKEADLYRGDRSIVKRGMAQAAWPLVAAYKRDPAVRDLLATMTEANFAGKKEALRKLGSEPTVEDIRAALTDEPVKAVRPLTKERMSTFAEASTVQPAIVKAAMASAAIGKDGIFSTTSRLSGRLNAATAHLFADLAIDPTTIGYEAPTPEAMRAEAKALLAFADETEAKAKASETTPPTSGAAPKARRSARVERKAR